MFEDAPVIYSYSRAQAIEDGVLVDVTEMAKEAGFKFPTAVSQAVWAMIEPSPAVKKLGEDAKGRLWDVLNMAIAAAKCATPGTDRIYFGVILRDNGNDRRPKKLYMHIGPGDTPAPVLTIMVVGED